MSKEQMTTAEALWELIPLTQEEIAGLTAFCNKEQLANILCGLNQEQLVQVCLTSITMRATLQAYKEGKTNEIREIIGDGLASLVDSLTERLGNIGD